ncbi:putative target of rapamycin (TOR) kinase 1 [Trypanosoma cruzi]|uniref:Putative target of rapamycin (TOR) kinase 1 n=1 Tax=Trypanosoma cruzi TaxID=5693 RepID=A0A2V2UW50_TRYCR|nr:putative target of rapamycin (TOR) kinase 1 [Trypanosoma cruzi]
MRLLLFRQGSATAIIRTSPRDCAGDIHGEPSPSAVGLGERLRHTIENTIVSESSSPRKRHQPPSSRMHRSMDGEPFLFQTPATLKLPGEMGEKPFLIMQAEARAVRLALSAFSAILPSTMDVWVDNTSPQGAANKGNSESHALTWELQRICLLTLAECGQLSRTHSLRKTPQTAYHAGRVFTLRNL